MSAELQTIFTGVVVLLAAAYIAVRSVKLLRGKRTGGCGGGCPTCPPSAGEKPSLVEIQLPSRKR